MPYSHPQALTREQALGQVGHLLPGALAFAGVAGFVNSVALAVFNSPVSHMTGAVSFFGIELARGHLNAAEATLSIVAAFMAGAALGGFLIGAEKLAPSRKYGTSLCVEATLLALAMILLGHGRYSGVPIVAMACGLQNATTSSYFGLMIRTTHVTGTVTEIGVMLGHWLRHRHIERRKLLFMVGLVAAFGTGVWIGAESNARIGSVSLVIPASGCALAGAVIFAFPSSLVGRDKLRSAR